MATTAAMTLPAFFRSVAQLGIQVAQALDHAHQQGVVHRDIKPSNILVDAQGKPWITDFGLARIETGPALTVSGDLLGTLRYMSPEQALAKRVVIDHRSDIYSLGVTLYELLTLQPAFAGTSRQELLRQIAFEEPRSPRKLNRATPADLETVVLKAMAKNPAERYTTAQALADDLRRVLDLKAIHARRPTVLQRGVKWARRHKAVVWTAAAVLGMALIGLTVSTVLISQALQEAKGQEAEATRQRDRAEKALEDERKARREADAPKAEAQQQRKPAEDNVRLALEVFDCRSRGRPEQAITYLSRAIDANRDLPVAYLLRATVYGELSQHEKAIADCSKAIALDPSYARAWNDRGVANTDLKQYGKAIADLSKAIELYPAYASAWTSRGHVAPA